MSFLTPLSLAFAALSVPLILLYMLKLRRRDVLVSSTLLWQRLLRDREANAPWQRLRRNLLMLLQLLVLALLTLSLARPFVPTTTAVSGSVVILLDASASMQARDVVPTRFEAGRLAAREIVAGLGAGDAATIIAVGPQPQVLASATGDRALLRRALDDAAPTDGPADWDAAFALAAAGMSGVEGARALIISDGALPETLPPLPGDVRFVGVAADVDRSSGDGNNLAITALATREGAAGPQAFLRVVNKGEADAEPLIEFSANGRLFDARRLRVPAQGSADLTLSDLPYDLQVLQARMAFDGDEGSVDVLPLDDVAWAVHAPPAGGRVLLVSEGNLFLERALGALPSVELARAAPDVPMPPAPAGTEGGYDLIVTDGVVTGTLAAGNLWLIGPPASVSLARGPGEDEALPLAVGAAFTGTAIVRVASDDPLLRYVDLGDVHVLQARAMEPPPAARVLVEAEGGPLLFVAERPGGRLAVLTFDLRDSDLPLQIAFPVLTANLVEWLLSTDGGGIGGSGLPALLRAGDLISVQPDPEAADIVVTTPDGARHALPLGAQPPAFAATDRLGVYLVEQFDKDGQLLESTPVAVNLFDEDESDIAPREAVRVGQAELQAVTRQEEGRREFWPWLAVAALGVLGAEWWVYFVGQGGGGTR